MLKFVSIQNQAEAMRVPELDDTEGLGRFFEFLVTKGESFDYARFSMRLNRTLNSGPSSLNPGDWVLFQNDHKAATVLSDEALKANWLPVDGGDQ